MADRARELRMAGPLERYDDGLAHDARLLARTVWLQIWEETHSYQMLRRSKKCVVNLPMLDLVDTVVGIGNCPSADVDNFHKFGLTRWQTTTGGKLAGASRILAFAMQSSKRGGRLCL
jgi:hypothetical protein